METNEEIYNENNKPKLKLVGLDGNAFSILGRARESMRKAKMMDKWPAFQKEATSGDYNKLLVTCMEWFDCDSDDNEDNDDVNEDEDDDIIDR